MNLKTKLLTIGLVFSMFISQLPFSAFAIDQKVEPISCISCSTPLSKNETCSFNDGVLTVNLTESGSIEKLININNINIVDINSIIVLGTLNEINAKFIKETFSFKGSQSSNNEQKNLENIKSDEGILDNLADDGSSLTKLFTQEPEVDKTSTSDIEPEKPLKDDSNEVPSLKNENTEDQSLKEPNTPSVVEDKEKIKLPRLDLIDLTHAKLSDDILINYFDGLESDTRIILPKNNSYNRIEAGFSLSEIFYSINNGKIMLYEHLRSGAKIIILKNDDESKKFSITFKTLPSDDTGTNHILEHCLVAASTKYNSSSIIHAMLSQFSNSDLNAMTSADCTTYIQESFNKKELLDMLKITINCIYSPAVLTDKRFFEREGIRYQLKSKDSSIKPNGIVYHEMERNYFPFWDIILKQLLVGTPFEWYTGGNPKYILDATYDNLKKTYEKFYTPSNSMMFLSGDFEENEINELFNWLDSEYLSKFSNKKTIVSNALNVNTNSIIKYQEVECPGSGEEESWKPSIIASYLLDNYDDRLAPLCELLSKELQKMGYNDAASNFIPVGNKHLLIVSYDDKEKILDKDIFKNDICKALSNIMENFDPETFSSMLEIPSDDSQIEFVSFAKDFANDTIFNSFKTTSFHKNPLSKVEFCNLIKSDLLDNQKYCITKFIPKSFFKENQEALKKRLADYKNSLSESEINNLIDSTNDFNKWIDNGSIFNLRNIQNENLISEFNVKENIKISEKEFGNLSSMNTTWINNPSENNIFLSFNTLGVPQDKLFYLTLLASLADLNFDFKEFEDHKNFTPLCDLPLLNDEEFSDPFKKINAIFENDYDLKKELQKIISAMPVISHLLDKHEIYKPFIQFFAYEDSLYSENFFKFIENLLQNIENKDTIENLKAELKNVRDLVFCKNNIEEIAIISSLKNKDLLKAKTIDFMKKLPIAYATKRECNLPHPSKGIIAINKGEVITENSISACTSYESSQYSFNEDFFVLAKLIQNNFLIPQLRLKGGTYDLTFSVSKKFSLFEMHTSQDADVMNSVKTFLKIPEFLESSNISKNDLDTAIFAVLNDAILQPQKFFGDCKNKDEIEKKVNNIKTTTLEKVKSYVPMLKDIFSKVNLVVIADSETIEQNKNKFDRVKTNKSFLKICSAA
ncbi:MAG: hypothetical protein RUMPE_00256 [Eubacteriales bacterium SKADARSKE-1]|nr:hypothetical protein [Eubacteriales bacterium SKADARSKE-1]